MGRGEGGCGGSATSAQVESSQQAKANPNERVVFIPRPSVCAFRLLSTPIRAWLSCVVLVVVNGAHLFHSALDHLWMGHTYSILCWITCGWGTLIPFCAGSPVDGAHLFHPVLDH